MSSESLFAFLSSQGVYIGTFLVAFCSGFFPLVNLEIYLVGLAALMNLSEMLVGLAFVAGAGQISAKLIFYWLSAKMVKSRWLKGLNSEKAKKLSERVLSGRWSGDVLMFSSALTGLPPIYLTSIIAGSCGYSIQKFAFLGLSGRFLRFFIVIAFPTALAKMRSYF